MSVDQVRVHIVSRSPQCSTDLAFLAHEVRRRHPVRCHSRSILRKQGVHSRREIAGGGPSGNLPALFQTAPPLVGGVAKPSPKLPRG